MLALKLCLDGLRAALRGISWNWTAIGTVFLAVVTLAALVTTIVVTRQDRRRADEQAERERSEAAKREARDRADADMRLQQERDASEQRIREEREQAAKIRRREAQRAHAIELIRLVALLQPLMASVPGVAVREAAGSSPFPRGSSFTRPRDGEAWAAIESLRIGTWTEGAMLGGAGAARQAAERCRQLVRLVDEAARTTGLQDRDVDSLLNFGTWVRISLRMLAGDETVPPICGESAESPVLGQVDLPPWVPNPLPPEWNEETAVNAPLRRSVMAHFGTGHSKTRTGRDGESAEEVQGDS